MSEPDRAGSKRVRMDAWRRRFNRTLLRVAFAVELPFGLLVASALEQRMSRAPAIALSIAIVLVVNIPLFYRFMYRWSDDPRASPARAWLTEVPFYIHALSCFLYAPLAYIAITVVGVLTLSGAMTAMPPMVHYLAPLYFLSLTTGLYGSLVRRFWTVTNRVTVLVPELPAELDGYTMAQLSDLHCGPFMPRWFYRRLARRSSALGADAIVLTGDMISDGVAYLDDLEDFVKRLSAPDGVFASLGNHDYFGTTDGPFRAMRDGGATVLRNEGIVVRSKKNGAELYLAAVDDSWTRRHDIANAMAARVPGQRCVMLAHDPALFDEIAARGDVDLVLSGHTHGGQFAMPFLVRQLNLARLRYKYTAGSYRVGTTALYVHCGNGTSGPPARFGAAPEIALLTLRRAPSRPS